MRLWSISAEYLDPIGLVALWREGLLGRSALVRGRGAYYNHPQLLRFKRSKDPLLYLDTYLNFVWEEGKRRGYDFDRGKIGSKADEFVPLTVTRGQVEYEWGLLIAKLSLRNRAWLDRLKSLKDVKVNPLFVKVDGPIEEWEKVRRVVLDLFNAWGFEALVRVRGSTVVSSPSVPASVGSGFWVEDFQR